MLKKFKYSLPTLTIFYIILVIFLYFASNKFFLSDFIKIEDEQNRNHINTILNIINQNLDNIKKTANDYSKWDDSYQFIEDKNKEYIFDNFREGTTTLEDLNIDGIIYHTLEGEIIFSKYLSKNSEVSNKKFENLILKKYPKKEEISTIIYDKTKVYYYSRSFILKSDNSGETKGYISIFKHLNLDDLINKQSIFKNISFSTSQSNVTTFLTKFENIPNIKISVNKESEQITNIIEIYDLYDDYIISFELKDIRDLIINSKKTIYIFNISMALILLVIFYFIYKNQYLIQNQNLLLSKQVDNKTRELEVTFRELKDKNKELYTLAHIDSLTKIKNRRSFFIESENRLEQSIKENKNLCLLLIDIDHFKAINDKYGHAIGDKVLIEFSLIVTEFLDENMIFGRIGGEEFCITFFDKKIEEVEKISEDIRKKCEETIIRIENKEINFTVSMGLTQRDELKDIDKIIHKSDLLLYKAKNSGRNRILRAVN